MKIIKISKDKPLRDRVAEIINSLKADEVLTSAELLLKLNLTSVNGRLVRILSGLSRKSVIIEGIRQWVYGTESGLRNLEQQLNQGPQ